MQTIHQLSEYTISQIAAGEIIERPAYVIKELIENAIDAKATSITITLEQAGLKRIIFTDNGIGMSPEDILECYKPHTTSKLSEESSLLGISSLGFRGEALASIAAVSTLLINSKTTDASIGTMITVESGKHTKTVPVGMPNGTRIEVVGLFSPTPIRKTLLNHTSIELRYIIEIVTRYALAFPNIRFTLFHNGKTLLELSEKQEIVQRISKLLGQDLVEQLLPISYSNDYLYIRGFISKPQSTNSTKQYLFVNNRFVQDKTIARTIKQSYYTLLPFKSSPTFILSFQIPYELVNVNIHPKKEYVNFINSSFVIKTIQHGIEETLKKNYTSIANLSAQKQFSKYKKAETTSYAANLLKDALSSQRTLGKLVFSSQEIIQLNNLYLITLTELGILIVDQHAAHERILFEQFLKLFYQERRKKQTIHLQKPQIFDLSIADALLLKEHTEIFSSFGFRIEKTSSQSFILNSVPLLFKDRNCIALIKELLEDIRQENYSKTVDNISYRMLTFLACRSSIKAGNPLTKSQMKKLLGDLEKTENNITCPHGRPTKIIIETKILDKMFNRR